MTKVEVPLWIGWVCVVTAILAFGFFTTPLKLDCVKRSKVDPFMIQLFIAVPVFVFSLPTLLFEEFQFSFYGIWGAAIWTPVSILSIIGVHFLGIAVAQALWGGLTIIFSFLWGVLLFREQMNNLGLTVLGILLLTIGIIGTTLSDIDFCCLICSITRRLKKKRKYRLIEEDREDNESEDIEKDNESEDIEKENETKEEEIEDLETENESINGNGVEKNVSTSESSLLQDEEDEKASTSIPKFLLGFISIFIMSLLNGSLMVPAKLDNGNPLYFFSFGVGVLLFSPFLITIVYFFKSIVTKSYPYRYEQVRDGCIPGLLVGIMFVFGNYAQTYAVFSPLGVAVGFPLCQTCMVLTAFNGMVFFGELNNYRKKIQFLLCCLFLVIPGFFLVAIFGMQ